MPGSVDIRLSSSELTADRGPSTSVSSLRRQPSSDGHATSLLEAQEPFVEKSQSQTKAIGDRGGASTSSSYLPESRPSQSASLAVPQVQLSSQPRLSGREKIEQMKEESLSKRLLKSTAPSMVPLLLC